MEPEYCPHCARRDRQVALQAASPQCPRCATEVGKPNVRAAAREAAALDARLAKVAGDIDPEVAQRLRAKVGAGKIIVSVAPSLAVRMLKTVVPNLVNRDLLEKAKQMRFAAEHHAAARQMVEGKVFPNYGDMILYAALSPDGRGLRSYGAVYLVIDRGDIEDRISFMEKNSYHLVRQKSNVIFDEHGGPAMLPPGYRATLDRVPDLAVVKLAHCLKPGLGDAALDRLIFAPGDGRDSDEFIEAHIYDFVSCQSIIEFYLGPAPDPENDYDESRDYDELLTHPKYKGCFT